MAVNFPSQEIQTLYENRFCYQEDFDIIISGKHNDLANTNVRSTYRISYPEFEEIETLYSSIKYTNTDVTVCERSNVWIICRKETLHKKIAEVKDLHTDSYKIYLDKTNQWVKPIELPDSRVGYSACSFMKSLYVFAGCNGQSLKTCLKYDTITSKWTNIASMNSCRHSAACTVYEGKIVVTAGYYHGNLKSVESFHHHENK